MNLGRKSILATILAMSMAAGLLALAGETMSPDQFANLRMRVETGTALAAIVEHQKDGEMGA